MRARLTLSVALATCLAGCAGFPNFPSWPSLPGVVPGLFSGGGTERRFDFEGENLGSSPAGFTVQSGAWSVADSPTAASGAQVLAGDGRKSARLELPKTAATSSLAAEVHVRVFLGGPGAGLSCVTEAGEGYEAHVQPSEKRIALLYVAGDSSELVASHPMTGLGSGSWARLGLLCRGERIAAYLDGKAVASAKAGTAGDLRLALSAGDGVVAQFDDLRAVTR